MRSSVRSALVGICVVLSPAVYAQVPRSPLGVYAKVDTEDAIKAYPGATPPAAQLHPYLQKLYASLLADPAISGLAVGAHWDNIQLTAGSYDWSYLDDAFMVAAAANKTIQLIITPGFNSPQWLLTQIPSCDPLFPKGSAPANCGTVTFAGFPEQQHADGNVLPLPWNSVYQAAWDAFLTSLAARYGSNPSFVSIAVAGPVGASDEMIFPNSINDTATQPSGLTVDATWAALIQHSFPTNSAYQNTDQVFIDQWKQAIDAYQKIFSGITLFIGADSGDDLPGFSNTVTPHPDNTLFAQDCSSVNKNELMSCEAKTEILSYFVTVAGPNGKATQVGGMTASSATTIGNIGVQGVKVLTALSPPPAPPFTGGAEFDFPVSGATLQTEGCAAASGVCPGLTAEQAAYNVMTVFFTGTPAAAFYGGTLGTAPLEYLDVPYTDVQYALANPCPSAPNSLVGDLSLQDLYNHASRDLLAMANHAASLPPLTCTTAAATPIINLVANAEGENPTIAPNTWVEIKGLNLSPAGDSRPWQTSDFVNNQMPVKLDGVSVKINGESAYVGYISPTQINILTPPDVIKGMLAVQVTNNGVAGPPFTVQVQPISPSFFVFNGGPYVVAQHADGSDIGPASLYPGLTTPAAPGEVVVIYASGFGPTSTLVVSGSNTQSGTLSPLPVVTIGGLPASVQYAGLISPGLFQFNVVVPLQAPVGDNTLAATYNGAAATPTALITIQVPPPPPAVQTFYVAPNGNDSWSGTLPAPNATNTDGPFASFDHARAMVRTVNKTGLTQVNVQFRAGTYFLPATEMLTAADSGSTSTQIVYGNYPGESPVISGGARIQNWTNAGGNTWKTTLPASTNYFENLFYNGVRRLRPRLGATASGSALGAYYRTAKTIYLNAPGPPAAAPNASCAAYVMGSGWECFDRFQYFPGDPIVSTWKNFAPSTGNPCGPSGNAAIAGDIEVLVWEQFSTSKLRISCIDTTNHIVYLTGPTGFSQANASEGGFIAGNRYLVDNVQDELTQPGQWFLDHSTTPWTLTYLANPGENPNTDLVIVPQLPQVLVASNLQYVTFQGLTFEHDNYTVPAAGHKSAELESDIGAAVSFQNSQHITFDSGIVTQTSGSGLEFIPCINANSPAYCVANNINAVVSYNLIQNSAFYDIGVVPVRIGNPFQPADTDANVPQSNTVQNNVVEGYGRTIPASFGIGQGEGHDNLYTHNDVYDGYHCAISTSQSIGDTMAPSGIGNANNVISFNHVYNLLQGIMNDGGSIRIDGGNAVFTAAGNKILNNKIHDVTDASIMDSNGYGGNGIYLDNNTGLVDVENNLVYRVSGFTVYTPHGPAAPNQANIIKNNILAYGRLAMVSITFPYGNGVPSNIPQVFNVTNNLFYFDRSNTSTPRFWVQGGCVYAGGAPFTQFQQWNTNLYWRTDGAFASDTKAFEVQPNAGTGPQAPCSGNTNDWTFYTFAAWQQTVGEDLHSVVQNPGFNNPVYPADDYSLPKGSPGAGFVVFDPNQAGRSNPVIKPPAIPATFPTKVFNPATDF
jgi:uncharacterized protein (TIGR03437 family)